MAAPTLSAFPPAPVRGEDRAVFTSKANALVAHYATFVNEMNNTILPWIEAQLTTVATGVTDAQQAVTDAQAQVSLAANQVVLAAAEADRASDEADRAELAASAASGSANYRGLWVDATGSATKGGSYFYNNAVWLLLVDTADITATVPSLTNPDWLQTTGSASSLTTLTKNFNPSEEFTLKLSSPLSGAPIVSVTKEVPQTSVSNDEWETAVVESEFDMDAGLQVGVNGVEIDLTGGTYVGQYLTAVTNASGQISTDYWTDIVSMSANDNLNGEFISYAISDDNKTTFYVVSSTLGSRNVVRDNLGVWEYNTNLDFASETWTPSSVNTRSGAFSDAMGISVSLPEPSLDLVYDSGSTLNVSLQSTNFEDCFVSPDGTRLYGIANGATNVDERVYQYNLSSPNDIGTASYSGNQLNIGGDGNSFQGVCLNTSGTRVYVCEGNAARQYNLSTPFDLSSAGTQAAGVALSASSNNKGIAISNDGTKLIAVAGVQNRVYTYTLSTPFELSSLSYSSVSFSVAGQVSNATGITFSNTGLVMVVTCDTTKSVYQYDLTSAFDISSASYSNKSFSLPDISSSALAGVSLPNDTSRLFLMNKTEGRILQANTNTALNAMPGPFLSAATDTDFPLVTDTLDLSITMRTDDVGNTPTSNGVVISYDANSADKLAINGTEYTFEKLDSQTARITWTDGAAANVKVKVRD